MAQRARLHESERGRHTRIRILEAARELFARHGFDGTTVRMIAERCDMTDPALYYHFRSKREMHDALLVQPSHPAFANAGMSRGQVIDEILRRFFEAAENPDLLRMLLRDALGSGKASADFHDASRAWYEADIGNALRRLYGRAGNSIAEAVYLMLSGLMWDALLSYGERFEAVVGEAFLRQRVRAVVDLAIPDDRGVRAS
jgi:AcrR family transcriptional regulator